MSSGRVEDAWGVPGIDRIDFSDRIVNLAIRLTGIVLWIALVPLVVPIAITVYALRYCRGI